MAKQLRNKIEFRNGAAIAEEIKNEKEIYEGQKDKTRFRSFVQTSALRKMIRKTELSSWNALDKHTWNGWATHWQSQLLPFKQHQVWLNIRTIKKLTTTTAILWSTRITGPDHTTTFFSTTAISHLTPPSSLFFLLFLFFYPARYDSQSSSWRTQMCLTRSLFRVKWITLSVTLCSRLSIWWAHTIDELLCSTISLWIF